MEGRREGRREGGREVKACQREAKHRRLPTLQTATRRECTRSRPLLPTGMSIRRPTTVAVTTPQHRDYTRSMLAISRQTAQCHVIVLGTAGTTYMLLLCSNPDALRYRKSEINKENTQTIIITITKKTSCCNTAPRPPTWSEL